MKEMTLNGAWKFVPDPFNEGEARHWHNADYDTAQWREVSVPTVVDNCGPGMASYEGQMWFRRDFAVPGEWRGKYLTVRFGAVNYTAKVYVNGVLVGDNSDGFLPFDCDITEAAHYGGENHIVVCVDNTRRGGDVPGLQRGWRPFGGILRDVTLLVRDRLHLDTAKVVAYPDGTFLLTATVENTRAEKVSVTIDVIVEDEMGAWRGAFLECQTVEAHQSEEISVSGRITSAVAWTPDTPILYKARIRLRDKDDTPDRADISFGFRKIEVKDGHILLNGRPLVLLGYNRHEDSPTKAMCVDRETARQDLGRMKASGANFVRLCHYPHDPTTLTLCDEIGLLVMAEIPLYWWGNRDEDHIAKLTAAKRQLTRLIERDCNHLSVIFWSVSNETNEDHDAVSAGERGVGAACQSIRPDAPYRSCLQPLA